MIRNPPKKIKIKKKIYKTSEASPLGEQRKDGTGDGPGIKQEIQGKEIFQPGKPLGEGSTEGNDPKPASLSPARLGCLGKDLKSPIHRWIRGQEIFMS